MIRVRSLAALTLWLAPGFLQASSGPEYSRRVWRTQDGLPQSEIQAIAQTPDGYLWIGTPGGLVRFDGVRFVVFDRSNTPAFRDDSVLSLAVDGGESLWIGSEGGGLVRLRNGQFQAFGSKEGLTNLFVRALHVDRTGALWVGTDRGLFRFDAGKLVRQDGQADLPVASVQTMTEDRDGRIWIGGYFGLMYVERGKLRRYPFYSRVRSIRETSDGTLWLATTLGVQTLRAGAIEPAAAPAEAGASKLYEDSDGNLWIGTIGDGLVRIHGDQIKTYREEDLLPDNSVLSIFEDRERNLWVGTHDGLLRLSRKAVASVTTREGLGSNNVSTVYEDPQRVLWLTTVTGGLYRVDRGKAVALALPCCQELRAGNVFRDRHGVLWVGTLDRGIARIEEGKTVYFTTSQGLRNDHARQFLEDRAGRIWVATGSGLLRWTGAGFQSYYLEEGLAYGSVRAILELRHGPHTGDLLVATDGGLNRIHDTRIVRDSEFEQFAGEKIWAIHEDSTGVLWLGTRGSGLMRWKDGKTAKLGTRDGLPSNSIYQILEDAKGRLWMSSPAGIFSAPREDLDRAADGARDPAPVVAYGIAEGLESTQMNGGIQPAGCRTASGDLWFPSVKGAVHVDPGELRSSPSPPVLIESMVAGDAPIAIAKDTRIPPGRRKLEIHFTVCNLGSPERIAFKYKLEGFDEAWAPASKRRVAYYTNLRPGNYRFRVIAEDAASQQNPSEASVAFRWEPYFYETSWFFALCAALAGLAGWAALRFYARHTKSRYALLLAERTRLAREMHDTVIQGCVGVSTLLEAAGSLRNQDTEQATHLVEQARTQVRLTLDEARQAVWDLRHSSLHGDLESSLTGFARQLSEEHGIEVSVQVAGTRTQLDEEADRNLLLVAREAIWNALAHGAPRHIAIRLSFEAEAVRLEVSDDGRGFEPATARGPENGHFGILGMRERMEQLGGSLEIRSGPGKGSQVLASAPL